jgi:formylglycine-generating enzyme required for sulfatase activity
MVEDVAMSRVRILMLLVVLFWALPAGRADDVAQIDQRVQQAREAYDTENDAIRAEITKQIEAREAAERKRANPDLDRIKAIKTELTELNQSDTIPGWVSAKIKSRIKKNTTTFVNALTAAKGDYLRAKDDEQAEAMSAELEAIKTNGLPARDKAAPSEKPSAEKKPSGNKTAGVKKPAGGSKWKGWPKNAPPLAVAPFDAEQAQQHQEAWAKYLKINVEYTNKIGMKFRLIPPGEFQMGSTPAEIAEALKVSGDYSNFGLTFKSEAPQHKVTLTHPIYFGVHEVTQSQYEKVMGTSPSHYSKTGKNQADVANIDTSANPVETASWYDAAEFCSRLSVMEKLFPFYNREGDKVTLLEGNGYRLATEAEWEFACRAGTTTKFWSGDNDEDLRKLEIGWHWGGRPQTVGKLKANPFGIYDTVGNVREWTDDYWDPTWYSQFQATAAINPRCPQLTSGDRVVRGGCYGDSPPACRSAARIARPSTNRGPDVGFRVIRTASAVK